MELWNILPHFLEGRVRLALEYPCGRHVIHSTMAPWRLACQTMGYTTYMAICHPFPS